MPIFSEEFLVSAREQSARADHVSALCAHSPPLLPTGCGSWACCSGRSELWRSREGCASEGRRSFIRIYVAMRV